MTNGKTLPQDVADLWPEIFNEIEMNVVPLNYVHLIEILFKNEKVWKINFRNISKNQSWDAIEQELKSIVKDYEEEIQSIDFRLDTDKIKREVSRSTKKFLKNKKLR